MYNPHTHLDIARARHDDLLRSAEKARLASLVEEKRPSPLTRIKSLFGEHSAKQPVVRPASV
jgi:hypothetical protein